MAAFVTILPYCCLSVKTMTPVGALFSSSTTSEWKKSTWMSKGVCNVSIIFSTSSANFVKEVAEDLRKRGMAKTRLVGSWRFSAETAVSDGSVAKGLR